MARYTPKTAWVCAGVLSLVASLLLVTNAFLFKFFGEYLFPGAVAFVTEDFPYLWDCFINYFSISSFIFIVVIMACHFFCLIPHGKSLSLKKMLPLFLIVLGG